MGHQTWEHLNQISNDIKRHQIFQTFELSRRYPGWVLLPARQWGRFPAVQCRPRLRRSTAPVSRTGEAGFRWYWPAADWPLSRQRAGRGMSRSGGARAPVPQRAPAWQRRRPSPSRRQHRISRRCYCHHCLATSEATPAAGRRRTENRARHPQQGTKPGHRYRYPQGKSEV